MKKVHMVVACLFVLQVFLHANEKSLDAILQNTGKFKKLAGTAADTKQKKRSPFIFNQENNCNGIGLSEAQKNRYKDKSKCFNYENKSKFHFRFNKGFSQPNIGGMNQGRGNCGRGSGGRR